MEDLVSITLAVEGMKATIIKSFDVAAISEGIRAATEKAVDGFNMEGYVAAVVEEVFDRARDVASEELYKAYGHRLAEEVIVLVDNRLKRALKQ